MTNKDEMPDEIWTNGQFVYKSKSSVYSCDRDGSNIVFAKDSPKCVRYTRADLCKPAPPTSQENE